MMKNKLNWLLIIAVCLSSFIAKPQTVHAQDSQPPKQIPNKNAPYVPGQIIVVFRKGYDTANLAETARGLAESVSGNVLGIHEDAVLLGVDKSIDIHGLVAGFDKNTQTLLPEIKNDIAYTQPNYIFDLPEPSEGQGGQTTPHVPRPNDDPNDNNDNQAVSQVEAKKLKSTPTLPTYPADPLLFDTWGWWNSNTDVIWQDKSASPTVCLLDTGVDAAHPDLAGKIINGKDVVNNDSVPDDDNGHGTHVAGVIAAKANNKIGIAGVSNSKILAIKVMNFQGQGDTWDIGDGIKLCADNPDVKIINMSFGTSASDEYMYQKLEYAIVTKGKLVVAAAGNDSSSDFSFPAAWAGAFVCGDGNYIMTNYVTPCRPPYTSFASPNLISDGLISVGAVRTYWSSQNDGYDLYGSPHGTQDGYLWVDDGDSVENVTDPTNPAFWNEHSYISNCATSFSNYGNWVSIAAPGESVTSTVPVSYPYYQQFRIDADPDGDGYDTWNGTSMAAPFVTGIAARVWSIGSGLFGTTPTNALVKDQLISTGYPLTAKADPTMNQTNWGYYANYGGEAPFCWPDASLLDPYYSAPGYADMSNTRVLNAADAMNRTSLYVYLYNALNGLPLKGATVTAYQGTTVKSQGLLNSNTSPTVVLPNVARGKTYSIKIDKSGFTNGPVVISQLTIPADYAYFSNSKLSVSVPPMDKITGVIDWVVYDSSSADMDLYSWLPNNLGAVGYNLGVSPFIGRGRMYGVPYAHSNLDMGFGIDSSHAYSWAATESISIEPRSSDPTTPYYNTTPTRHYDFLVHGYSLDALDNNDVYFRLWVGGKIKATVFKDVICGSANSWWEPGYMKQDKFYKLDTCGDSSIWPY